MIYLYIFSLSNGAKSLSISPNSIRSSFAKREKYVPHLIGSTSVIPVIYANILPPTEPRHGQVGILFSLPQFIISAVNNINDNMFNFFNTRNSSLTISKYRLFVGSIAPFATFS